MSNSPQAHNVRHELPADLVQVQIEKAIARHEADRIVCRKRVEDTLALYAEAVRDGKANRWVRPPDDASYIDPMIDGRIAYERSDYAKVRVIELPKTGKRFVLVYGDVRDAEVTRGTGPFESLEVAAAWFLKGGR
jgi:hypothetical protein